MNNKQCCNCDNKNIKHISDLENIKPESVAFVSYLMDGIPYADLVGEVVNVPFLACKVGFVLQFFAMTDDGVMIIREGLVIFTKDDYALSLVVRSFVGGKLDEDSIGLFNFIIQAYDQEVVVQAIKDLPLLSNK